MKDLAQRAAKLFGKREHNIRTMWGGDPPSQAVLPKRCLKCQKVNPTGPCPIPDPIDITDLGKALECFRGLVPKLGGVKAGTDIFLKIANTVLGECCYTGKNRLLEYTSAIKCILFHATAEQIWEICILAKESE